MENRRFLLFCALGVVLFFLYQAWQKDFAVLPPASPAATPDAPAQPDADLPEAAAPSSPDTPASPGEAAPLSAGARVRVETDRLAAEIATVGGDLRRVELKGYPLDKHVAERDVALLDDRDGHWFVIQSGLTGAAGALATQRSVYTTAQTEAKLAEGAAGVEVVLEHAAGPYTVRKIYRFKRDSYEIELEHVLVNASGAEMTGNAYVQLWRTPYKLGDEPPFMNTFMGVGLYEAKNGDSYRFRKLDFDDLAEEPYKKVQTGGWIAMVQHYFFAAVLPPLEESHTFIAKPSNTRGFVAQYLGAPASVAPGGEHRFTTRLYVGPKTQVGLGEVAKGLDLTIDYGILTPIAEPLFWLLKWFHDLTRNWGAAIILLTLAVKLALFKLSEAQYRSFAKMRKFAPRIQDIKERYGDDRERLHKAMMELYKKEKFNPLAGCWPLLVQFPVFIALYWVLLESVELRQADFVFWLDDLSAADPYFVLPVLFGISMFIQQKLSGSTLTMEPMQQRVMNAMPIMLTAFFAFFPAGLVLYWFVSNVIGIAQQWWITRKLEREGLGHR